MNTPAIRLRVEFQVLVLEVGEKEARRLWADAAKRPRGRPRDPSRPEQNKALLALVDALNKSERTTIAQAAKLIHDAFEDEYGPSAKFIETKIRNLRAAARQKPTARLEEY